MAQAGRPSHAVAFHKAMEDTDHSFLREPYISPDWLLLRFRESLPALLALPTLDIVPSTSSLHRLDFAGMTRHFGPCFLRALASKMAVGLRNPVFSATPGLGTAGT